MWENIKSVAMYVMIFFVGIPENIKSLVKYVAVFLVGLFGPVLLVKVAGWPIVFTIASLIGIIAIISLFLSAPPRSEEEGQAERRRATGGTAASASGRRPFDRLRRAARFAARVYASNKIAGGKEGVEVRRSRIQFGRFLVKPTDLQEDRKVMTVPGTYIPVFIDPMKASDDADEGWGTGTDALPPDIGSALPQRVRKIKDELGPRAVLQIRGMWEIAFYVEVSDQVIRYNISVTTEQGLEVTLKVLMRAKVKREADGSLPVARARLLASYIDQKHEDYLEEVLQGIFLRIMTGRQWEEEIQFSTQVLANATAICEDALSQLQMEAEELGLQVVSLRILGASDVSGGAAAREAERLRVISGAFGGGGKGRADAKASPDRGAPTATSSATPAGGQSVNWMSMIYTLATQLIDALKSRGGGSSGGSSS